MSTPLLEASDLGVCYTLYHGKSPLHHLLRRILRRSRHAQDQLWALRRITFQVNEGERLGIIGRNGAGKSTLFLVLSRILDVDEGRLSVRGKISTLLTLSAGFRGDLTGRDNLYLSASLLGLTRRRIAAVEHEMIAFAELERSIDEPIRTYSTGMRARLGLAIAVHVNPDILLMDEVLSVGDESFKARSRARIHDLLGSARAILIVSHAMDFVREYCSRVIWLDEGRIRQEGDPEPTVRAYLEFCRELRQQDAEHARQLRTQGTPAPPPGATRLNPGSSC